MLATQFNQMVRKITVRRSINNPTCEREVKNKNQHKQWKNQDLLNKSEQWAKNNMLALRKVTSKEDEKDSKIKLFEKSEELRS